MDFVVGLPKIATNFDSICVIVDRLTKSAHFLPVKTTYTLDRYARLYVNEIMRLHGAPVSILSDGIQDLLLDFGQIFNKLWV